MTTNDAVARIVIDLNGAETEGEDEVRVATKDLRAVLDRLEAAEFLLYEADQISRLIEPDFYEWRERYARFGGRDG